MSSITSNDERLIEEAKDSNVVLNELRAYKQLGDTGFAHDINKLVSQEQAGESDDHQQLRDSTIQFIRNYMDKYQEFKHDLRRVIRQIENDPTRVADLFAQYLYVEYLSGAGFLENYVEEVYEYTMVELEISQWDPPEQPTQPHLGLFHDGGYDWGWSREDVPRRRGGG
jgi:hypothetical protein